MRTSLALTILALALAGAAWGQRPARPGAGGRRTAPKPAAERVLERWNRMPPEERERTLRQLPPERRRRVEERLEKFNRMPERERERLTQRYERFAELTAEKQELMRRRLREFRNVPEERRRALAREFRRLRGMAEVDRRSRIETGEFRDLYSPEERQMLRDLSENLSPAPK